MRGQGRVYRPTVRRRDGVLHETGIWWLDYSLRGQRHQESSHTTRKKDAQRLLRERMADREAGRLVGPSPDRVTFQDLRTLVERQYELDGRRSLERIQIAFDHLATCFGTKDETGDHSDRVVDITPARADAYTARRLEKGAARATVNRELAALRRGFRLAVEKGLLAIMPRFKIPKEDNARTGYFEAEDLRALLAELPAYLRGPVQFMALTGWRDKSEVLRLTWAHVDFDAGVVRLDVGSTKNGEGRTFPFAVLPQLETVLAEAWAARDGLSYSTARAGRSRTSTKPGTTPVGGRRWRRLQTGGRWWCGRSCSRGSPTTSGARRSATWSVPACPSGSPCSSPGTRPGRCSIATIS